MNHKKMAFVIHGLSMGGAEKFLICLANYMHNIGSNPIIILLSDDKTMSFELNEKIEIYQINKKYRYDISVSKKIKKIIIENKCDNVFCINSYSFFLTKILFLNNKIINFYLSPHTTAPFSIYNYFQTLIYYTIIGKNDTIIYLCKNQKNYIEKIYFIGRAKKYIIYNGINIDFFNPQLIDEKEILKLKKELKIENDEKIIVQVARISKEKRHIDSIKALSQLHKTELNRAHLLLVGPGDNDFIEGLKNEAKMLEIDKYVHFIGHQSDVRKYYSMADIFTLTSTSETFSLAALEAMAYGIPCALTNVGGAEEMIDENITGILMEKKDIRSISTTWSKLLKEIKNKELIRNYVMSNFTSVVMLDKYKVVFENNYNKKK